MTPHFPRSATCTAGLCYLAFTHNPAVPLSLFTILYHIPLFSMSYRLRISAGPSLELSAQSLILVNNDECPLEIHSPHFRGRITVRVKEFSGVFGDDALPDEARRSSSYFNSKTATFSLQCQGMPNTFLARSCFVFTCGTCMQVNMVTRLNLPT